MHVNRSIPHRAPWATLVLLAGLLGVLPSTGRGRARPPQEAAAPPAAAEPEDEHARAIERRYGRALLDKLRAKDIAPRQFMRSLALAGEGMKHFENGDLAEATDRFRRAYELVQSPQLLYYMAVTYEKLGNLLQARQHHQRFLAAVKTWDLTPVKAEFIETAAKKVSALLAQLVSLRLDCSHPDAQVFLNGEPIGRTPLPGPILLPPGTSLVVVLKKGFAQKQLLVTERTAGATIQRTVTLLSEAEETRQAEALRRMQAELRDKREADARRQATRQRSFRLSGYSLAGAGLGVLLVAGVLSGLATMDANSVRNVSPGTTWESLKGTYDRGQALGITAYGLFGLGAAATVTGAVLLGLSLRSRGRSIAPAGEDAPGVTVLPTLGPTGPGLSVTGRF